jgi:predicted RNA-binding protein with PUA-like domain
MVNNEGIMAYWLVKSEPSVWSWTQQSAANNTPWNGVRNNQALGYMRQMAVGDQAFFYHSNEERQIVGIVEITRSFYPDVDDAKSGLVDVKPVCAIKKPVTLAQVKATAALAHLGLVRQSRLSVMEIDAASWKLLLKIAGE